MSDTHTDRLFFGTIVSALCAVVIGFLYLIVIEFLGQPWAYAKGIGVICVALVFVYAVGYALDRRWGL